MTSLLSFLLLLAAPPAAPAPAPTPEPPFAAWVLPGLVYVRHQPKVPSELAGALRRGDLVQVEQIVRDAEGKHPWALINGGGAVPLGALRPGTDRPEDARVNGSDATFVYARVSRPSSPVFAAPDDHAAVKKREKAAYLLAFVPDPALQAKGWLRRSSGGFMRVRDLSLLTASTFTGEPKPTLPLAFIRRTTRLLGPDKSAPPQLLHRYDRLPVLGESAGRVLVKDGAVPRQFVRIAYLHKRPAGIPRNARWVRVDLAEQTLVAYEGDTPVFATLVSAGRDPHPTKKGVFRIFAKTVHSTMRGRGWADYVAEEVPWPMHFYQGQAMHGAFWHDQFGIVKSHGCVNLSVADAKWLFDWMPPPLPAGWHTLLPGVTDPAVYIDVDRGGDRPHPPTQPNAPKAGYQWAIDHKGAKKVLLKGVGD